MKAFWAIWAVDLIAAIIILYFLVIGISDGSVSGENAGLWLALVLGAVLVLAGSILFIRKGIKWAAYLLLALLAIPALLMLLFALLVVFSNESWQ